MSRWLAPWLRVFVACLSMSSSATAQVAETIAEIRVHGNHSTPDAEIIALAELHLGEQATPDRLDAAVDKLRASGRFENIELRRRYRSIADPSQILIVLVVDERPAVTRSNPTPGPIARLRHASMWLPLVRYSEGYGLIYGARVSAVDLLGPRSRLSAPLTWGGERRAAIEVERSFLRGPFSSGRASISMSRSINPHFTLPDMRREASVHAERRITPSLRVDTEASLTQVTFGTSSVRFATEGARLTVDTRLDPAFPRNAVHIALGMEHLALPRRAALRSMTETHAYIGIPRSAVIAVSAMTIHSSAPLPPFEQSWLGGRESIRGYRAGYRAGDNAASASVEARLPLNSPLSFARFGLKAFVDAGTTWMSGQRLADQRFDYGSGAGVYLGGPAINAGVDVAWPHVSPSLSGTPSDRGPRWHFGFAVTF